MQMAEGSERKSNEASCGVSQEVTDRANFVHSKPNECCFTSCVTVDDDVLNAVLFS